MNKYSTNAAKAYYGDSHYQDQIRQILTNLGLTEKALYLTGDVPEIRVPRTLLPEGCTIKGEVIGPRKHGMYQHICTISCDGAE